MGKFEEETAGSRRGKKKEWGENMTEAHCMQYTKVIIWN
jgi:hypothetical protein